MAMAMAVPGQDFRDEQKWGKAWNEEDARTCPYTYRVLTTACLYNEPAEHVQEKPEQSRYNVPPGSFQWGHRLSPASVDLRACG